VNPLLLAAPVLAALGLWLWRRLREAPLAARRFDDDSWSRGLCSRARLIEGARHTPVSVALERGRIEYFNAKFTRAVELDAIETVEYLSDLVTGDIARGALMRVRAGGHDFDFVMETIALKEWSRMLPPR
jgi:hypothetical protein